MISNEKEFLPIKFHKEVAITFNVSSNFPMNNGKTDIAILKRVQ